MRVHGDGRSSGVGIVISEEISKEVVRGKGEHQDGMKCVLRW